MYLYLISQTANRGYDTFDSAIVAAETEHGARHTYPHADHPRYWHDNAWHHPDGRIVILEDSWTTPDNVSVKLIGEAEDDIEPGVVLASFNAG